MPVTIGIIYPPPEVRSIVDKTATFVARNGPEFEEKIRQNEINNTKFNFLNSNDPYHAYYQHKVKEIAEGKDTSDIIPNPLINNSLPSNMQGLTLSAKTQDTQTKIIEQIIIPKEPPPDFEFIADAPSLMPMDIDVIKLTAQFVARNGGPFRTNLMNKEQRNPMFDFLKPQHSHFSYFSKLVEQYTKILLPPRDLVEKLRKEVEDPFKILRNVYYRVEWDKVQQREKAKLDEMNEKERVAYAQIDWHDFVVVETVDYQQNEMGNFPPPTTPEDVGARIIALERIEANNPDGSMIDYNSRLLMSRIIDDESRIEISSLSAKQNQVEIAPAIETSNKVTLLVDKNIDEVAMDEDSDEEEKQKQTKSSSMTKKDLPLPPNPDHVIIRKDYDPKSKQHVTSTKSSTETYFKSPLTGELIPASSMSEHMRISMLDPRWIEQRQKEKKEREEQEEVLASGMSIERNLKLLAEYRSDVFGSGVEEVIIGKKIGEEEKNKEDNAVWDGHASTITSTAKRAMTGITIEEQIRAIHQSQGLNEGETKADPVLVKGPIVQPIVKPPQTISQQQQMLLNSYKMLSTNTVTARPPIPAIPMQPIIEPVPILRPEPVLEEPVAKRLKTEDQLIPEADYLAQHASKGPVNFSVQVPNVPDKPEWNLKGQLIPFTMPLTETISAIKNKLAEYLNLATPKQKLQLDGMFVKDTNTLAFYNLPSDATIYLQLKERGGKKK